MNLFLRTWSPFWILWKDKSKFSLFHFRIVGLGLLVRSMASSMDSLNNKIIFTISHSSWVPAENWVLCCFLAFKPVYTKAFRNFDYKFKIGALRISPTAGSRLKIGFSTADRTEETRKLVIWMPKVWLTKATRVGRRRLKASMVKGVKSKFVRKYSEILCNFESYANCGKFIVWSCDIISLEIEKYIRCCFLGKISSLERNLHRRINPHSPRWLGWCWCEQRSSSPSSTRPGSPACQRVASRPGGQGCVSSKCHQTFTPGATNFRRTLL